MCFQTFLLTERLVNSAGYTSTSRRDSTNPQIERSTCHVSQLSCATSQTWGTQEARPFRAPSANAVIAHGGRFPGSRPVPTGFSPSALVGSRIGTSPVPGRGIPTKPRIALRGTRHRQPPSSGESARESFSRVYRPNDRGVQTVSGFMNRTGESSTVPHVCLGNRAGYRAQQWRGLC